MVVSSILFLLTVYSGNSFKIYQKRSFELITAQMEVLTGLRVDLAKAVVAHLVHEAVEQDRRAFPVHAELSGGSVVVVLLDVLPGISASSDTHHPQELVYVYKKHGSVNNCSLGDLNCTY